MVSASRLPAERVTMTAMFRRGELERDLGALLTILASALLILAIGGTYVYAIVGLASINRMLPWLAVGTPALGAGLVGWMLKD